MDYEVQIVGDDELPVGVHSVVVERPDAIPLLLLNGAPAQCWAFMGAYVEGLGGAAGVQSACDAPPLRLVV